MPQRNVTITPHQERFVESALSSGQYGNVSEIFRAGLRLLEREEQERLIRQELLNRKIEQGIDDIQQGRFTEIKDDQELESYFAAKQNERRHLHNPKSL